MTEKVDANPAVIVGWTMIDGEPVSEIRFTKEDAAHAPVFSLVLYRDADPVRCMGDLDTDALEHALGPRNARVIVHGKSLEGWLANDTLVFHDGMSPARREFLLKVGRGVAARAGLEIGVFAPGSSGVVKGPHGTVGSSAWPVSHEGDTPDDVLRDIGRTALGPGAARTIAREAVQEATASANLQAAIDRFFSMSAVTRSKITHISTDDQIRRGSAPVLTYNKVTSASVPGFEKWLDINWQLTCQRGFLEAELLDSYDEKEHVAALRALAVFEREHDVRGDEVALSEDEVRLLDEVDDALTPAP